MAHLGQTPSPAVAAQLWDQRDALLRDGQFEGKQVEATVLFTDTQDFTSISEQLSPADLLTWLNRGMQVASLDHAMWFHRDFRFDDWLLYAIDSPSASGARGLVRGKFFTRDGKLVASTIQEGLVRHQGASFGGGEEPISGL